MAYNDFSWRCDILLFECGTGASEQEQASIAEVLDDVKTHEKTINLFRESHSGQLASMKVKALETFQQRYMVHYSA